MNFFTCLYNLLIGPLELLFEVIFSQANSLLQNPGFSIIFLSLAMNFLVLPLYKRADALQEEQRQTEERLSYWVSHIKKNFSGDERFMILQTYYRQNHYKPADALKGTTSLLLEIPFFIAAYNFLSGLQMLQGVSFGPIGDLGAPDSLIVIAGVSIHLLPIAMTLINLVSSAIYTKGMSAKSKIQLYGMALIFLILLYDSPSGLVFYWTLNNLFSLCKNIFYKLKNPRLVFGFLSSGIGILGLAGLLIFHPFSGLRTQVMAGGILLLLQLPLLLCWRSRNRKQIPEPVLTAADHRGFFLGCCFLTVLTGLLIPSGVLEASPEEFVNAVTLTNPLVYVGSALLTAGGTFLVWLGIFYMLASPAGKRIMGTCVWVLSGWTVIDYMFFGTSYGNLSANLQYDVFPVFAARAQLINLAVLLAAGAVLWLLYRKKEEIARIIYLAAGTAMIAMSLFNLHSAHTTLFGNHQALAAPSHEEASIPLSREGKNVVVLMMDRAVGSYLPFLMEERPELKQQFAGFTYYPNTASFGQFTNFGLPAIFGGYEYTPEEMNRRDEELLVDKHNEALRVLPVLFDENEFQVTLMDPSYAGYHWIPDLHVFDDYPEIRTFNLENSFWPRTESGEEEPDGSLYRNFFCYSLFKTAPVAVQPMLYAKGTYNEADILFAPKEDPRYSGQIQEGTEKAVGMSAGYYSFHKELEMLPSLTEIREEAENTFLILTNCTTHEPVLLQLPEYEMVPRVDNTEYDRTHQDRFTLGDLTLPMDNAEQMMHYHINMAAMLQLGQWLDYLRQQDVYDNTRIIIVADHGQTLRQIPDMNDPDGADMMSFNPLLMVKDFDSRELTMDGRLMTNADVPMLAMEGLIEDPHNPFTGKSMKENPKDGELHLFVSRESSVTKNNGCRFLPGQWIALKDSLFSRDNWHYIEDPVQ